MNKYIIANENVGKRLDRFLGELDIFESRAQAQKAIKDGRIAVNGKTVTPHYFLKEGDEVENRSASLANNTFAPRANVHSPLIRGVGGLGGRTHKDEKNNPSAKLRTGKSKATAMNGEVEFDTKQSLSERLKIIKQTDEYLVIDKPAGLIVHPDKHIKGWTLVDWLVERYPAIAKIGEDPDRPGIVHRLDKDVSGLMVVALTQDSFDNLKTQFQKRKVKKYYTALTYGLPARDESVINFPIDRATSGYRMAALPATEKGETSLKGRRAATEFQVLKRFVNYALLKVSIKTGRTHQIRVHMSAYGLPLVGDEIYNTKVTREKNRKLNLGRVFLVADELSFTDLAGEKQVFKTDLPEELKSFLKKLK